ncbi:hypothetical protein SODALDRAFT_331096 [Sodiomyces alkalinus F11]|uniref:Uncharacterized protein n=1 Tax=Sodiomyces alkalinus (strain CBS 110278 / VKM F-3762 / F11) TaxID=1314773 RepID=A0A3N2Q3M7_SODAK|nr:hypothetical protein SODALDRAFT_331096 [Sodiomyces alkalinus F11]ROT41374.1 hypothetical protein SODALDRAFT_331096 [Sodiomyces alkalinus F11]
MSSPTPEPQPTSSDPPREEGGLFDGSPIWVVIPLVLLIIATALASCIIFCRRRRRRLGAPTPSNWDYDDQADIHRDYRGPYANPIIRPTSSNPLYGRRTGWTGWASRSAEGLNEFGEAPPAYEPKAEDPAQSLAGGSGPTDHYPGPSGAGPAVVELGQMRGTTPRDGPPATAIHRNRGPASGCGATPGSPPFTPLTRPAPTHQPGAPSSSLSRPGPGAVPAVPPPDYGSATVTPASAAVPAVSADTRHAPQSETTSSPPSSPVGVIHTPPPPGAPRTP